MKGKDLGIVGSLAAVAAFIWLRDRSWLGEAEDVLPALAALPLFCWLGRPWAWTDGKPLPAGLVASGVLLFIVGSMVDLTLLRAAGWTAVLWAWLRTRTAPEMRPRLARLMVFPLMAFPWVTLDLQPLGWWFRLSGASAAAALFSGVGLEVSREGTQLLVQGTPIEVSAACSGLKVLQSLLIAGSFLAHLELGTSRTYWWNIALLPAVAWLANTARILIISVVAITWSPQAAMGVFHTWGGLSVLVLMFGTCWLIFHLQSRRPAPGPGLA